MKYNGAIGFQRELSFSQAQEMRAFMTERKLCLGIIPNGKGLQWDHKTESPNIAEILAEMMGKFFLPWHLGATGVIQLDEGKKGSRYDIVVVAKAVWIYDGGIKRILPTVSGQK